jgi:hypothetical protein
VNLNCCLEGVNRVGGSGLWPHLCIDGRPKKLRFLVNGVHIIEIYIFG